MLTQAQALPPGSGLASAFAMRAGLRFVTLPLLAAALLGQAPPPRTFEDEARVTAVDVVVEMPTRRVRPDELVLRVAGQPRPIVAAAPSTDEETWHLLLYLDGVLGGERELRRACASLEPHVRSLVALGEVEIRLADPEPRRLLAPTRDPEAISRALASCALEASGDDALTRLRAAFLDQSPGDGGDGETLGPADALAAETALSTHRLDTLLLTLVATTPATARRAVVWAGTRVDAAPETFYLGAPAAEPGAAARIVADFGRLAAAHGWVLLPLAPPAPENRAALKPGLRIGKLRFTLGNDLPLPGFTVAYEEERDAEKAAAFLAIGKTQEAAGELAAAAESYRLAIHHVYGDPRQAGTLAEAYSRLAGTLERLGEAELAHRAREAARELTRGDGGEATKIHAPAASNAVADRPAGATDPGRRSLAELAEVTAGMLLENERDFERALESLGRRVRVTFQVDDGPTGRLARLELSAPDPALEIRAPAWSRSGVPEELAAARLRELALGGEDELAEPLAVELRAAPGDPARLELEVPLSGWTAGAAGLRLSVGRADGESPTVIEHHAVNADELGRGFVVLPLTADPARPLLLLLLEDLAGRRRGVAVLETPLP